MEDHLNTLLENLQTNLTNCRDSIAKVKALKKEWVKLDKKGNKKVKKSQEGSRAPSGFAKPTHLTPELCKFLDIPQDSMLSRTDVTRKLNVYLKANNLQNPKNKKEILPNDDLKKLLKLEKGVVLTYFNLQKYMKHLFVASKN